MTTGAQILSCAIAERISRDRFREISRYLHFVDNTRSRGSPGYDRLGKVRPVIDHLAEKFTSLYEPHKEVSVDEGSIKQYMPMKPLATWKCCLS